MSNSLTGYEVTRDATGKATAVPVFDQPYGMDINGEVRQTHIQTQQGATFTKAPKHPYRRQVLMLLSSMMASQLKHQPEKLQGR